MVSLLKRTLICCFAFAAMVGCDEKPTYDKPETDAIRVLVTSEGAMGSGTGSITAITNSGVVSQDVFKSVNNRPLGDVAQSLAEIGDYLYVALNNSRKIEVIDKKTFKSVETILMPSASIPVYVADIGNGKIAITEKGTAGGLVVANAIGNTDETVKAIEGVGQSTQMQVIDDKLFIGGSSLKVFDIDNGSLSNLRHITDANDWVFNSLGDSKIVVDKNNKIWMIHGGYNDFFDEEFRLICVDPVTEKVIKDYKVGGGMYVNGMGARLDIAPNGEDIYFTARDSRLGDINGLVKFNINDKVGPDKIHFIYPKEMKTLYCMSISYEGTIFMCDAELGTVNRGTIFELTTDGKIIDKFETGVFPGYIHFMKK